MAQGTPGLIEIFISLVFEVTNLKQRKKCKKLVGCNLIFGPLEIVESPFFLPPCSKLSCWKQSIFSVCWSRVCLCFEIGFYMGKN